MNLELPNKEVFELLSNSPKLISFATKQEADEFRASLTSASFHTVHLFTVEATFPNTFLFTVKYDAPFQKLIYIYPTSFVADVLFTASNQLKDLQK